MSYNTGNGVFVEGQGPIGPAGPAGAPGTAANASTRVFRPLLQSGGAGILLVSGTVYSIYLGTNTVARNIAFIEFLMTVVGAGAQVAEVGIGSTPLAPNKGNQNVTCLAADAVLDDLTVGPNTMKRNTVTMAYALGDGVETWAMIRTAMAVTQPTIMGLAFGLAQGFVLTTAAGAALAPTNVYAGVVAPSLAGTIGPLLSMTMD